MRLDSLSLLNGSVEDGTYTGVEANGRSIDAGARELKHLCELDW